MSCWVLASPPTTEVVVGVSLKVSSFGLAPKVTLRVLEMGSISAGSSDCKPFCGDEFESDGTE